MDSCAVVDVDVALGQDAEHLDDRKDLVCAPARPSVPVRRVSCKTEWVAVSITYSPLVNGF
jgi:hypothetical protein